ncbi:MAG: hypothetical protein HXY22_12885 [Alphaproteobacteria bacterium]|nr:hypothetical protein [Alphaproteobacteria bacterium]
MKSLMVAANIVLAALLAPPHLAYAGGNPEERASFVDWEAARLAAAKPEAILARKLLVARRAAFDLLRMPLLVPREETRLTALDLSAKPNLYTARFVEEEAVITITGILTVRKPLGAPRPASSPSPRLERTDAGIDIAFTRFGVSYHIAIECKDPQTDRACREESFARNLIDTLAVIIPQQEGTAP